VVVGRPYAARVSSCSGALSQTAALNLYFEPGMLGGVNASSLRIYHWDAGAGWWVSDDGAVDLVHHFVSTEATQLTTFVMMAEMHRTFLSLIIRRAVW
jgi:hypothetical protein